jgi:hypothetical protein
MPALGADEMIIVHRSECKHYDPSIFDNPRRARPMRHGSMSLQLFGDDSGIVPPLYTYF